MLTSKLLQEVLIEIDFKSLTKLISGMRIWNTFNNSSKSLVISSSVANAFVRSHKQVKVIFLEDLLEQCNDLQSNDILAQIVIHLKDTAHDSNVLSSICSPFLHISEFMLLIDCRIISPDA